MRLVFVFFFKQKTAYEVRISDWSSDVCSSDLRYFRSGHHRRSGARAPAPTGFSDDRRLKTGRFASGRSAPPHKEGRLPPMRHGTPMSMNLDCSRASTCPCNSPADWAKNGLMHMFGTGASPRTEAIIRPVGKRSETTGRSIPSDAIRTKCSKIHRLRKPFWHVPQSDPQVTCEAACRSRLFSACYS